MRLEALERRGLLAGGQDERRQRGQAAAELAQRGKHVGRRAIGIVEHQKRRLLRIARAAIAASARSGAPVPAAYSTVASVAMRVAASAAASRVLPIP